MTCRPFEIGKLSSLAVLLVSCAGRPSVTARDAAEANDTGAAIRGQTDDERALLAQLPRLPTGKPQRVQGLSVVADEPYEAASGRRCRPLHVQAAGAAHGAPRLACSDGTSWFFVPDVFVSSTGE